MTPVEKLRAFFKETGRRGEFDDEFALQMLEYLDTHGILIVSNTGIIGGMVTPLFPTREVLAQEVFWWGDASLLKQFETRARHMGATAIHMMSLNQRVAGHYLARGYKQLETVWVKEF